MRPYLAISMGDPAGIGPEVALKALAALPRRSGVRALLVGVPEVFVRTAQALGLALSFRTCSSLKELAAMPAQVLPVWPVESSLVTVAPGKPRSAREAAACGQASYRAVCCAVELVQQGWVAGLVTAPVAKRHWELAGYDVPGHTELLARLAGNVPVRMMLAGPRLRVVLMTTHLPLREVTQRLSMPLVDETIFITYRALRQRFAIRNPRLAVAGVNPHAGEGGMFGDEDERILRPAVGRARQRHIDAEGPLPADTVYYRAASGAYDAVLAPYHDQALAPFKLLHFQDGVNVTLGLPFVRTSPDHGTAFDIAGKGVADPSSMAAAIRMAAELVARTGTTR